MNLRRRPRPGAVGSPHCGLRRLPLWLGLLTLSGAWLGPLPELAPHRFAAHMAMHIAVVAVAAPLIALGIGGSRFDPSRRRPGLFSPLPVSALELVVIWGWHAPALHHFARHAPGAMALEQSMFLLVSLALWLSALGGAGAQRSVRAAAGIGGLLMTSMHMTLLGALLAVTPRTLYDHGGVAALDDQHVGGVLMLLGGGTSYLFGGLALLGVLLRAGTVRSSA